MAFVLSCVLNIYLDMSSRSLLMMSQHWCRIWQQAIISTNVYPNTPRHNEIDPPIIENVDIYMFVNMCVWIWLQMNMKSKDKQLIEAEWRIYAASN